jgi:hypothetical protein
MSIQVPNIVVGDCGSEVQLIVMIKAYACFYRYLISLLLSEMIQGEQIAA